MKRIRANKNYILYKDELQKLYVVERKKDGKCSAWMNGDDAEGLIMDEGFERQCKHLNFD